MSGSRSRGTAPTWDAPLTVALLVAGVINVTVTVAGMRELPAALQERYSEQGIGTYASTDLANAMGWSVIVVSMLALVLAIGFAVPRLRAHRLAFWIPLTAAAASLILTTVLVAIAVVGDPAGAAYLQGTGGSGGGR
jgi:Family of unknown function (DUF6264)